MVLIADPNANAVTAGVNAIETASAAGETSLGVSPAAEAVVVSSATHSLPAQRRSVSELSPARLEPLAKRQRRKENEQISTGVPICTSRMPLGPALLKHRKRVKGRKADLLSSLPTGKFSVALDVADNGRKCFTYFQSPENTFGNPLVLSTETSMRSYGTITRVVCISISNISLSLHFLIQSWKQQSDC